MASQISQGFHTSSGWVMVCSSEDPKDWYQFSGHLRPLPSLCPLPPQTLLHPSLCPLSEGTYPQSHPEKQYSTGEWRSGVHAVNFLMCLTRRSLLSLQLSRGPSFLNCGRWMPSWGSRSEPQAPGLCLLVGTRTSH